MSKNEFLDRLRNALSGLPREEIDKTIEYYEEMINDAVEEGEAETVVTARLGSIEEIAKKIIDEVPLRALVKAKLKKNDTKENEQSKKTNIAILILIIMASPIWLSLLLSVIAAVLSIYIAVWSVIVSLFVTTLALALSAAGLLIISPFMMMHRPVKAMACFGFALAAAGFSVLIFYLALLCAKLTIRATAAIIRKIKNMFIRKGAV